MKTKLSEYEIEAKNLLEEMNIIMESKHLYKGPYFEGEEDERDVYQIIFTKLGKPQFKPLIIKFGQSLSETVTAGHGMKNHPGAYDILCCIEKYEVSPIFEDWANEFGYEPDSIKASKTHQICLKQYRDVSRFFTSEELEKIQEIQ